MTWLRLLRRLRAEVLLWGLAAWRGLLGLINGNDLTHAAAIAYYALLSLFPFLLLVISLLGAIAADDANRLRVLSFVFEYFPGQIDFVATQLEAFREVRLPLKSFGALALIWASLGVFGAVTAAVNEAWGVEKQRSFWKHRMVSFLMLVAAGGVMIFALVAVSILQVAETTWFGMMLSRFEWLNTVEALAFRHLPVVLLIVAVGLVFYFIPNAKIRFRDVWVGAILTGVLWRAALEGFSVYVANADRLTMIHGSIATVVVFLFWMYVSAIILMYGVEFTAAYARLRRHRPEAIPAAPSPRV